MYINYTYSWPGVHIYAVGVGDFDTREINAIASDPSDQNAFILKDYNALGDISSSIVKKTCRGNTGIQCPPTFWCERVFLIKIVNNLIFKDIYKSYGPYQAPRSVGPDL